MPHRIQMVDDEKPIRSALHRYSLNTRVSRAPRQPEAPTVRLRVLVAEDNPVNQLVARRLLERIGHTVTVVENGRLAVETTAREEFDAVLMDVQMPEMCGFEATGAIRERERGTGGHLPIIGLTAHAMQGDRERCLEAGMDDYTSKPVDPQALRAALARLAGPAESAGSAAEDPSAPITAFNRRVLDECFDGNRELLREVADTFLESSPPLLTGLKEAIAVGDAGRVQYLAHRLKGSMATFGADAAVDAAFSLEQMSVDGDLTGAAASCAALFAGYDQLRAGLEALLERAPRSLQEAVSPALGSRTPAGRPLRVLVADDDRVHQELARKLLTSWGHQVVVAGNGREAVDACAAERFDLLLMDLRMPEMDGFAATAEIRAWEQGAGRRTPIVAVTALATAENRERCLGEMGMDDCIAKPLCPGEILGILRRVSVAPDSGITETSHLPGRVPGPVLDEAALINLVAGDRKLLREFIDLFLEQSPQLVADIGDAVLCGERAVLAQRAHALRGAAVSATGHRVAAVAYRLETAARAGNWTDAEQVCATLRGEFARLRDALGCARAGALP